MTENTAKMIIRPNWKKEDESYAIFDYLKNHHTLLIAIISAIITITSFIINQLSHFYQYNYLRSWGIAFDFYVNPLSNNILYYFSTVLVIDIITPVLLWKLEIAFISFYRHYSTDIYSKYILDIFNRRRKKVKTQILKLKKSKAKKESDPQFDDELKEIEDIKKNIKKSQSITRHIILSRSLNLILLIFSFALLLLSLWSIISSLSGTVSSDIFIIWFIYCITIVFLAHCNALLYIKPCTPRKIKKILKNNSMEHMDWDKFNKTIALFFSELPVKNSKIGVFSDNNLKRNSISILVSFFVIILVFLLVNNSYVPNSFWIYNENGSTYAVIYQRPDLLIMEKADMQDNSITIYLDQVKYMQPENCFLQKKAFDTVLKRYFEEDIENEDNFSSNVISIHKIKHNYPHLFP